MPTAVGGRFAAMRSVALALDGVPGRLRSTAVADA
jgi:hypothetical protein